MRPSPRFPLLRLALLLLVPVLLPGCQTAYYSVMEKFGFEKRDLLKSAVVEARDQQKQAGEQFGDALERMRAMYGSTGTDLEKTYDKLKADHDACASQAKAVKKRIRDMDGVATALFTEWEREIGQFTNPTFAAQSRTKLEDTRSRYTQLATSLGRAEASMDPVLQQLGEHVLFLKHNLNAAAIGSLRGEATNIQGQIDSLITQMNASISEADAFIRTLD